MTGIVHAHLDVLDELIEALTGAIATSLTALRTTEPPQEDPLTLPTVGRAPSVTVSPPLSLTPAVERLDTIPGMDQRGAEVIVVEIGIDLAWCERHHVWRRGLVWHQAMMNVRASNAPGKPSRATVPSERS